VKIRQRESFAPIHLASGDTIKLTYTDEKGKRVLAQDTVDRAMMFNEGVIFDVDKWDGLGWEEGIGGAVGRRADT